MHLKTLSLVNFKNFDARFLEFDSKLNCIVGDNGTGKTNIIDAIYHLSYTKSYFNAVATQNIQHEKDFFMMEGNFERKNRSVIVNCSLKRGQKKVLKRDGKEYEKLSDHYGFLPVVIISPADTDLIREGSEYRRKFIDGVIAMDDRDFLQDVINYNQVLSQRNALLKYFAANRTFDQNNLEIYNDLLTQLGKKIFEKRKRFVQKFSLVFEDRYKQILGSESGWAQEKISLKFRSQLENHELTDLFKKSLDRDKLLQFTTCGIHRDDLVFEMNGFPIKKFGSQGQQKSFLIALKLAQFDFIKQLTDLNPILLLDDIFDKLDDHRVSRLIELVNEHNFGQIFITDTHKERTESFVKTVNEQYKVFRL